jgi:hypothetical protein
MALQAIAHRLLEHSEPLSYADFLQQRLEIDYFAAAVSAALRLAAVAVTFRVTPSQSRNRATARKRRRTTSTVVIAPKVPTCS